MFRISEALVAVFTVLSFPVVLSCTECDELSIFDNVNRNSLQTRFGITLPGTKWCGPGDSASDKSDLGSLKEEDKCCRDHDNCDDIISAGETKHGLENPDIFTRLHCNCENDFQNCLRKVDSFTALAIGTTYTTARKYCFKFEYPIIECKEYQEGLIMRRCITYKLDKSKPKQWQWFDIPFY